MWYIMWPQSHASLSLRKRNIKLRKMLVSKYTIVTIQKP